MDVFKNVYFTMAISAARIKTISLLHLCSRIFCFTQSNVKMHNFSLGLSVNLLFCVANVVVVVVRIFCESIIFPFDVKSIFDAIAFSMLFCGLCYFFYSFILSLISSLMCPFNVLPVEYNKYTDHNYNSQMIMCECMCDMGKVKYRVHVCINNDA